MRKTKIVATIGPASREYSVMKKMVEAGLNIIRLNLSHSSTEGMGDIVDNVKRIRKELNVPLPIMVDTRGPEIRVKTFEDGSTTIKKGQTFIFTGRNIVGDNSQVAISMPSVISSLKAGDKILACDGLITFKIEEIKGKDIITKAQNSGVISNRKSLFIPGVKLKTNYLNESDKKDLLWAIKNDADLVAASFVNSKHDVQVLRDFIVKNGGNMKIISKIESQCGVDNIDEIIEVSDGIMVARGDLGVEVPMPKLPEYQKQIIKKSVSKCKPVITATEMLESMINNRRPTRAEISDVANAVYDGTSCVMLSGETAMGKFPVDAIRTMAEVAMETEQHLNHHLDGTEIEKLEVSEIVAHSAVSASLIDNVKAIVTYTDTGLSAGLISHFRPGVDIIGATPNEKVYRQLELMWGIKPMLTKVFKSTEEMFENAKVLAKASKVAKTKDTIIITCGEEKHKGATNLIKISEI